MRWGDNVREWTGLDWTFQSQRAVEDRQTEMEAAGCKVISGAIMTLWVKGQMGSWRGR